MLKPGPAKLTPFFEQPELAHDGREQFGFQKVWTTPDRRLLEDSLSKQKLYIAPVTVGHLRPVIKPLAWWGIAWGLKRHERGIATRLHKGFPRAFECSPAPYYHLTDGPGRDTVILQLALTELSPTSAGGSIFTTAVKFLVTPIVAPLANLGGFFTKGNIAIEGKMLVPMDAFKAGGGTARPATYFQFADNEADKPTFLNARDFQPYGHAVHTMRERAVHFEEMTRTPRGTKVGDSSAVTLRLY